MHKCNTTRSSADATWEELVSDTVHCVFYSLMQSFLELQEIIFLDIAIESDFETYVLKFEKFTFIGYRRPCVVLWPHYYQPWVHHGSYENLIAS